MCQLARVGQDMARVIAEIRVVLRNSLRGHQLVNGAPNVRVEVATNLHRGKGEREGGWLSVVPSKEAFPDRCGHSWTISFGGKGGGGGEGAGAFKLFCDRERSYLPNVNVLATIPTNITSNHAIVTVLDDSGIPPTSVTVLERTYRYKLL